MPRLKAASHDGSYNLAKAVLPSFTNPNNISVVTGQPPSVHGISGNFFLDRATGAAVPMADPSFMRAPTILSAFSQAGVPVAAVTAKDKLRRLLGHGLAAGAIAFSSEQAATCTVQENGIHDVEAFVGMRQPDVYSAELSLFVLHAGTRLVRERRARLLYLSLTDYVQHTYAPGDAGSDDFHRRVDAALGELIDAGAVLGLIADHGMNDKAREDGSPNIVFVQDALDVRFGAGASRVILPITDPYVAHHGALGGYVRVYCTGAIAPADVAQFCMTLPGVEVALERDVACALFDLPPDREGDVAVIADARTALGSSASYHDLAALAGHRLRSHGGMAEQTVPFITSAPLTTTYARRAQSTKLHNYDIFDFVLNGTDIH
jgi:phosphonoacetate hydrolase